MHDASDVLSRKINTVGEIIASRTFLTFRPADRIEHIVHEMIGLNQGAVGITTESGALAGLLTERDVLRKIFGTHGETQAQFDARNRNLSVYPGTLTAADVMTKNPVCVTAGMPVEGALDKIKERGFRHMPVLDRENGKLAGIVSERELFWHAQEKFRTTIRAQTHLLSYFINEPYGSGATMIDTQH